MTAALAVAAPQWRIGTDRSDAARVALAAGADELHLDFGGAHRGALLSEPGELRAAMAFAGDIPVPVLAVNHVNDIGLAHPGGVANAAALALVERALESASSLGARVLHVPGFRRSLPDTEGMRAGTVEALRVLCGSVCAAGLTLAYESPSGPAPPSRWPGRWAGRSCDWCWTSATSWTQVNHPWSSPHRSALPGCSSRTFT